MRVSVRENDPGFNMRVANRCKVFVNGVDVTNRCYTADEEKGIVWCYKWNEEKRVFLDPIKNEAAQKTLRGKVEIIVNARNGVAL